MTSPRRCRSAARAGAVPSRGAAPCGSLLALIVLGLAWELWLAPTGRGTLALKVLPLLLPLAGLLRNRLYTYRWVSLLVWLYFTEGVVRADQRTRRSARALALRRGACLCLALFAACALHVRWRLRQRRRARSAAA